MPQRPKPIDFNAIRKAISNTVEKYVGGKLKCIQAEQSDQNRPSPPMPYMTFKIIAAAMKSGDDHQSYITDETWSRSGQRVMTVSFQCFAAQQEEAYEIMSLWQAQLELNTVQEYLRRSKIAVWLIGGVADLTQLHNTGYEARSQMDVTFGIASNLDEDLGSIETVGVEGEVDTDQEIIEVNFDAP